MRARKEKVIATLTGGLKQIAGKRKRAAWSAPGRRWKTRKRCGWRPSSDKPPADERIRFEHCILATGSRPARIAAFDLPTPRMMDSTGALELPDVPESLLVVGGGYIGLEMGTVYAALGSRVSVVELTDGLLPGVDRDLVRPLEKRLEAAVRGHPPQHQAVGPGREEGRRSKRPSRAAASSKSSSSAACWLSVGRRPNSDGLGLENTKVEVDPQGFIVVDPQRRTADPHILAIGDVAGQPMLAHKASHEGKVAVEALAGQPAAFEPRAIPGGRLHRSGDRLGRTDRDRGPAAGPPRRGGSVPLGRQRPGPSRSAAPKG